MATTKPTTQLTTTSPPLRHLDLDLEEPMGGICGTNPRRIHQVRLAEDSIDAFLAVGVKIG